MSLQSPDPSLNHLGDLTSFALIIGVFSEWLPVIAAVLAILWTLIRMFEWFRFRVLGKKDDKFS